jgi:CBS domain-containing protein
MPIGDYCQKPAATVRGDETIHAAATRMTQERIGSLAVVEEGRPVGIVTDRDVVLETLCKPLDPASVKVGEITSRPLVSIEQDAPVREAARMIRRHGVRRLPVVDEKGQLVGIVTGDDLLSLVAGELNGLTVAVHTQTPKILYNTAMRPFGRVGGPDQGGVITVVAEHYRKQVATIAAEATARDAADAMRDGAVGSLVVLRNGAPVGIVTDRDLLERVVAAGKDAAATSSAEVMSQPLQTAGPEEPLERIVERMSAHGIRRVPVVREGELIGIVSLDDVLAEVAQELQDLVQGTRRELFAAQRAARAREIARDVGERVRDLGEQLEHLAGEAKDRLLHELDDLRERMRRPKN